MRRAPSTRAFALADFVAGVAIFAGAILAFAGLTRTKFEVLHEAGTLQIAQADLEATLDALRRDGLPAEPSGAADARGFQVVKRESFDLARVGSATRTVSARPLIVLEGERRRVEPDLLEVRAVLEWRDGRLQLSTLLPRRRSQ